MTTKDVIIQQLNDKLAAALEQEKASIIQNIFVQPAAKQEEQEQEEQDED